MTNGGKERVSVIIVNWNTSTLLRQCLESLQMAPEYADLEIVVVDNNSSDNSVQMVRENFPTVVLIQNACNDGFARAVNQGFAASTAPCVLLLNSDTEVRPGAIAHCRDHLDRNPEAGAVGCRIENPDGSSQNSIFRFPSLRGVLSTTSWLAQTFPSSSLLNHDRYGLAQPTEVTSVDVVMGSYLMVRRSDHGAQLLDDNFFMYGEEADLCRRLKARGMSVQFVPDACVMHVRSASSRTPQQKAWSDEAKKRSQLRFLCKWHGTAVGYAANILMIVGLPPRILAWLAADAVDRVQGEHTGRIHKASAIKFHLSALAQPAILSRRFTGPPAEQERLKV